MRRGLPIFLDLVLLCLDLQNKFGDTFAVQAMLLSRLANGLLGALSGCVGKTIISILSRIL